jgi:hypothetical protein
VDGRRPFAIPGRLVGADKNAQLRIKNIKRTNLILAVLLAMAGMVGTAAAQVEITVDRNSGYEANPGFKFKQVPAPVKDNAAAKASLKLVIGQPDGNSAGLKALTDGILPASEDEPEANFFFADGTDGGRFLLDFGRSIEVAQVNSYSWHPDTRGPQVYNLFASDGTNANFNPAPDAKTDPVTCGWKLIATVDTRSNAGDDGGQYGVSITDTGGTLGKFRYLLFDSIPTEIDDDLGNTFFSEINVIVRKP